MNRAAQTRRRERQREAAGREQPKRSGGQSRPSSTVSIEIDATPAVVWAALEPVERHVDWMHDAVAIRFTSDQTRGVGTTFVCDTKVGPIKLVDRMEITEWQPEAKMGVRHTGIVTGSGMFTLTPIDLGRRTRFGWTETLRFPWYLGGRIGEAIGGNLVMKAIWRRNLKGFRRLVEALAIPT